MPLGSWLRLVLQELPKCGLWERVPARNLTRRRRPTLGRAGWPEHDGKYEPNYAGGCVPLYPPDPDCADLRRLAIALPARVVGRALHRPDGEGHGLGCE